MKTALIAVLFISIGLTVSQNECYAKSVKPITDTIITGGLFDENARPQLISNQFSFTEGAAVDRKGNIFFTDQPNNKIWKYSTAGHLSVFLNNAGRSNGMYFDKKGNLISCADEHDQLWSISPKGRIKILVKDFRGHRFNGPNDVWVDPQGGIYFTDPYFQRTYWNRTKSDLDGEKVYYLANGSKNAVAVATDLKKPNGIVGTIDGKYLYVADIGAWKTYKYRIGIDGTLTEKQLFVDQGGDGMTIDERGNVYLCGKGVTVFDPNGKKIAYIPVPEEWTGNLCFGGKNKSDLFITACKSIYILHMKIKGVE